MTGSLFSLARLRELHATPKNQQYGNLRYATEAQMDEFYAMHEAFTAMEAAILLLSRLNQWDALNPPEVAPYGDAPYWKECIENVLARFDLDGMA